MTRAHRLAFRTLLVAAATVAGAGTARAQGPDRRCELEFTNTPTTRVAVATLPDGKRNLFLGGGFRGNCVGQDITLASDSAEYYEAQSVLYLIGNVRYNEPRVRVEADRMTYYRAEERLLAEGHVYALLPSGTTMRGPTADYYRAVPPIRTRTRVIAPGRPQMKLIEQDSTGKRGEPTQVVANTVVMEGDSVVYAGGRVEITRTDVEARGDSAFLDSGAEFARLMRGPSIVGKQKRPFTLRGGMIDLFSKQRQLTRVIALREAVATSEDMNLKADTIDMRLGATPTGENGIERVFAWGRNRARVTSPERDITADSLDVQMPGQRLQEVHAVRQAFAQVMPDTTKIRTTERDWLRGDTIVARFDTTATPASPAAPTTAGARASAAAPRDTTTRTRIRDLVAQGNASSFHQLASQQGPTAPPSINYVRGRQITVTFAQNAVDRVVVLDRAAGLYLEAATDSAATAGAAARGRKPATPAPAPSRP